MPFLPPSDENRENQRNNGDIKKESEQCHMENRSALWMGTNILQGRPSFIFKFNRLAPGENKLRHWIRLWFMRRYDFKIKPHMSGFSIMVDDNIFTDHKDDQKFTFSLLTIIKPAGISGLE